MRRKIMTALGVYSLIVVLLFCVFALGVDNNMDTLGLTLGQAILHNFPALIVVLLLTGVITSGLVSWILKQTGVPLKAFSKALSKVLKGLTEEDNNWDDLDPVLMTYMDDIWLERGEIERTLNTYRENVRVRQEFTANVTHELKTPLTSINGYAEMIAQGFVSPEDTKHFAGIILEEGNRLLELIDETLKLSRFDSGYEKVAFEEIDLYEVALNRIQHYKIPAAESRVSLFIDGEPAVMYANKRMMIDVISNLVGNAIKYNRRNGAVHLEVYPEDEDIVLICEDTGIGISENDQERVFERFFVVDRNRRKSKGTGLGLALVKHMVRHHGGTIKLESILGKGSCFTIRLPKHFQAPEVITKVNSKVDPEDQVPKAIQESPDKPPEKEPKSSEKKKNKDKKKKNKKSKSRENTENS